jgi:hypothetical protein
MYLILKESAKRVAYKLAEEYNPEPLAFEGMLR